MPLIPRGAILTVDITQVGSTVPGGGLTVHVVGKVINSREDPTAAAANEVRARAERGARSVVGSQVRIDPRRARAEGDTIARLHDATTGIERRVRDLTLVTADLRGRERWLRFTATIETVEVGLDLVPWAVVGLEPGQLWVPVEGWLAAKQAPVGASLDVDVLYATSVPTIDSPTWASILRAGSTFSLPDGANRTTSPHVLFS